MTLFLNAANTSPLVCVHHNASEISIQGYLELDDRKAAKQNIVH